jgi:hypothetical protein
MMEKLLGNKGGGWRRSGTRGDIRWLQRKGHTKKDEMKTKLKKRIRRKKVFGKIIKTFSVKNKTVRVYLI